MKRRTTRRDARRLRQGGRRRRRSGEMPLLDQTQQGAQVAVRRKNPADGEGDALPTINIPGSFLSSRNPMNLECRPTSTGLRHTFGHLRLGEPCPPIDRSSPRAGSRMGTDLRRPGGVYRGLHRLWDRHRSDMAPLAIRSAIIQCSSRCWIDFSVSVSNADGINLLGHDASDAGTTRTGYGKRNQSTTVTRLPSPKESRTAPDRISCKCD